MKKNQILTIVMVAVGGLVIWQLFKKPSTATTIAPTGNTDTGGNGCIRVPENFAKFQTAVTPSGAKEFLGVTDAQFTDSFQARLLGFFSCLDVEPDEYVMKYFGKESIIAYLNSPDGQLAHWQVVRGSKRCQSTNATYSLI